MKRKICIIILIFILVIICLQSSSVYAGLASSAQSESGYSPPPPTPSDADPTPTSPQPSGPSTPSGPPTVTIPHYTYIQGNVYEDLGYSRRGTSVGEDDRLALDFPISDVLVNLIQGDQIVASTRTDENGNYRFDPVDGTYSIEIWYGDTNGVSFDNVNTVKNVLKYNGQDYMTVGTPTEQDYLNIEQIEIKNSGKGAAQIYIALDCSASSRTTMVDVNGIEKSRLRVEVEAASRLINSLLNSGQNIYVGLVFFSGTSYRSVYLCKNETLLNSALTDILNNNWYTPNTDIVAALDKAYNSFANNAQGSSNRYIILLSDGIPTAAGDVKVYCDESEEETLRKLYGPLKSATRDKVLSLKNDGVNVFSLLVQSSDQEEYDYVESIYGDTSTRHLTKQDGAELAKGITEDLKQYIYETTEVQEYKSGSYIYAGYEDAERRKAVYNNFESFYYGNTSPFKMIDEYDASSESQEIAKWLSDKTKMCVIGGSNYSIQKYSGPVFVYEYDDDGNVTKIYQHVNTGYSGQNFILGRIPESTLQTKVTLSGLRITLIDGQTIYDVPNTARDANDFIKRAEDIVASVDDELVHGSTIELEYTITVYNTSSIPNSYLEILTHIPAGYMYSPNHTLLTEKNKTNSDKGWVEISLLQLYAEGYIDADTLTEFQSSPSILLRLDNEGKLGQNQSYSVKFVVSQVIGGLDYLDPSPRAYAEVMKYSNNEHRRNLEEYGTYNINGYTIRNLRSVYPGNSMEIDFSGEPTNDVFIIPPTGIYSPNKILLVIFLSSLMVITIIYKKKIKNRV